MVRDRWAQMPGVGGRATGGGKRDQVRPGDACNQGLGMKQCLNRVSIYLRVR